MTGISALAVPILPQKRDAVASMTSARLAPERLTTLLELLRAHVARIEESINPLEGTVARAASRGLSFWGLKTCSRTSTAADFAGRFSARTSSDPDISQILPFGPQLRDKEKHLDRQGRVGLSQVSKEKAREV